MDGVQITTFYVDITLQIATISPSLITHKKELKILSSVLRVERKYLRNEGENIIILVDLRKYMYARCGYKFIRISF